MCITRSKSNVIWQVFLGIRGPPGNLNQQQWFFPCHVKHNYSAASLTIFSRTSGISSFIHSYDCCLFRSVFNFSLSRQLRIGGLIDITKWWRNILFSTQTLNQNHLISQNCETPIITPSLPYRGVCLKPSRALSLTANTITAKLTNIFTMIYRFRLITLDWQLLFSYFWWSLSLIWLQSQSPRPTTVVLILCLFFCLTTKSTWYGTQRFDCLLQVFFRRWGRLVVARHYVSWWSVVIGAFRSGYCFHVPWFPQAFAGFSCVVGLDVSSL